MDALKKMENNKASDYVVDSIRAMLNSGKLRVGDKLPSELELCEHLGVGRSSLREGIKVLTGYGFLEIRRGQGTYVADNFVSNFFNILGFSHTGVDLTYFLSVRHALECGCVRIISGKLSKEQCDELERISLNIDCESSDLDTIIQCDKEFHMALFEFTGNPLMLELYRMISQMVDYIMTNLMNHEDVVEDARDAHLKLVEALRNNDVQASVDMIDMHMSTIEKYAQHYILKQPRKV